MQPLAWEPPYAAGVAQEIATTTTKRQKTKKNFLKIKKKKKEKKRKHRLEYIGWIKTWSYYIAWGTILHIL